LTSTTATATAGSLATTPLIQRPNSVLLNDFHTRLIAQTSRGRLREPSGCESLERMAVNLLFLPTVLTSQTAGAPRHIGSRNPIFQNDDIATGYDGRSTLGYRRHHFGLFPERGDRIQITGTTNADQQESQSTNVYCRPEKRMIFHNHYTP
jgi:hypothetical protein